MELSAAFFYGVLQIILADIILAGDNALLIGIVIQTLPNKMRRKACILGSIGAVLCRMVFGLLTIQILQYPALKMIGGSLIIWIAMKLVTPSDGSNSHKASNSVYHAAWTIICADVVMSGDNVLAVAGVAHGNFWLFAFGIAFSLPLVIFTSNGVAWILDRWPLLSLFGAIFLGWVGARLITEDRILANIIANSAFIPYALSGMTMLSVFSWWYFKRKNI